MPKILVTLVNFHVDSPATRDYLTSVAHSLEMTRSEFIRAAIDGVLDQLGKPNLPPVAKRGHKSPGTKKVKRRAKLQTVNEKFLDNQQRPKRKRHWLDKESPGGYGGETTDNHGAY